MQAAGTALAPARAYRRCPWAQASTSCSRRLLRVAGSFALTTHQVTFSCSWPEVLRRTPRLPAPS